MINRIKRVAEQNPDKIAYKVNSESITYKELWDVASDRAALLKRQGSSPVVIYGHKSVNFIVSVLACLIADMTYVPIGAFTPPYRVHQIVEVTGSTLVLNNGDLQIENVECTDIKGLDKYEKLSLKEHKEGQNETVYIIFTSGSTGVPKGVPISKENLKNFIDWFSELKPLCDYREVNVLNQASFSFDLSVADFYYSLLGGHTLISFDGDFKDDDLKSLYELMREIDFAVMTPTFMKLCLMNRDFNSGNYPNFRCVYFCGEQLDVKTVRKLFEAFPEIAVINAYGPTEGTSAVSAIRITDEMADCLESLPVGEENNFATEINIIDGEIVLKGKSVFGGYLGGYKGSIYEEDGKRCFRTGDLGYIDGGRLYIKGRKDRQIKYKGYRIELDDIEKNIDLIEGVIQSAVIAKYSTDGLVRTIQAFVKTNGPDEKQIRLELTKRVPSYMIPKTIKIVDRLPVNENGKIDRKAISKL